MRSPGKYFLFACAALAAGLLLWFLSSRPEPAPEPPRPDVHDPSAGTTVEPPPLPVDPGRRDPPPPRLEPVRPADLSHPHVAGRVSAVGGAPVAGARLEATLEVDGTRRPQGHTGSAADGGFALEIPDWDALDPREHAGARGELSVSAEGMQPQKLPFRLVRAPGASVDAARLDVVLLPGHTLRGRLLDAEGRPAAGAEVALVARAPTPAGTTRALRAVSTHSAADGRFDLGFASTSTMELFAHADNVGVLQRELALESGSDRDLGDLTLVGPARLEGAVRFPDGKPAPDLELWAVPEAVAMQPTALALCALEAFEHELGGLGLFSTHARTDEQGRFSLRGLEPGRYMLRCPRPEVVLEPRIGYYHATTEDIRLELQSARLRVRAVDANGRVLGGARVRLTELTDLGNGRYQPGQIWNESVGGALGCASFEVQPETTYGVRVDARGFAPHEDLVLLAQNEYEQLQEYRLEPPAAKGRVQLLLRGPLGPPRRAQVEVVSALTGVSDPDLGTLDCDAEGWLPPLAPGRYCFSIGFREDAADPNWYLPLVTHEPLELPPAATRELAVAVAAGARLELELALAGPPPPGFEPTPAPELAPEEQRARAAARLAQRGAFVDVEGLEGQGSRRVQFWAADGGFESQLLPGSSGRAFELLTPGRWKVAVQAQGFYSAAGEIALEAGRFTHLRLELRAR